MFKSKKTVAVILCITVLVSSFFVFTGCSSKGNQVQKFDALYQKAVKFSDVDEDARYSYVSSMNKELANLGIGSNLDGKQKANKLDNEFIDLYLQSHSTEELLEKTIGLYIFFEKNANYSLATLFTSITYDNWHSGMPVDCACQCWKEFLNLVLNREECRNLLSYQELDFSQKGIQGFYTENHNADPQPYKEQVSGRFYSSSGTNVRYEYKDKVGTVEYYGDFAVLSETIPVYHEGEYKWVNGVFHDTLPSWSTSYNYSLYYRGERVFSKETIGEIQTANIKFFEFNGQTYYLYDCRVTCDSKFSRPMEGTHMVLYLGKWDK